MENDNLERLYVPDTKKMHTKVRIEWKEQVTTSWVNQFKIWRNHNGEG